MGLDDEMQFEKAMEEAKKRRRSSRSKACTVVVSGIQGLGVEKRDVKHVFGALGVESASVTSSQALITFREHNSAKEAVRCNEWKCSHGGLEEVRPIDVRFLSQ